MDNSFISKAASYYSGCSVVEFKEQFWLTQSHRGTRMDENSPNEFYLETQYNRLLELLESSSKQKQPLKLPSDFFPVNTHGGLLGYGAPWEVPAMFNVIEAVHQLKGTAKGRQLENCQKALVYGNGGVLSASAVAILSKSL